VLSGYFRHSQGTFGILRVLCTFGALRVLSVLSALLGRRSEVGGVGCQRYWKGRMSEMFERSDVGEAGKVGGVGGWRGRRSEEVYATCRMTYDA
jgi:hypothetical protein